MSTLTSLFIDLWPFSMRIRDSGTSKCPARARITALFALFCDAGSLTKTLKRLLSVLLSSKTASLPASGNTFIDMSISDKHTPYFDSKQLPLFDLSQLFVIVLLSCETPRSGAKQDEVLFCSAKHDFELQVFRDSSMVEQPAVNR